MKTFDLAELLRDYPPEAQVGAATVRAAADANPAEPVFVVLDDDPTGTQSIAGLPVLTRWEKRDLEWALAQGSPAIYVMTNSRSLSAADAERINIDVADAALAVARENNLRVTFVSRSDSTLRGHFPLEPDTLADRVEAHGEGVNGIIIVPAFGDAGRITIGGVHYAGDGTGDFILVGESEFADDATFGYTSSDLGAWVEEKTGGRIAAGDVIRLTLDTIRSGAKRIAEVLLRADHRQPIVADAVTENDLRQLSLGIIEAESAGAHFIYRVGPPFMRARIGQEVPRPLDAAAVGRACTAAVDTLGGLIVVGSHVPTTTRQLGALMEAGGARVIELDVRRVLSEGSAGYLDELAGCVIAELQRGNVVLHTSRELVTGADAEESLSIARSVSAALIHIVNITVYAVTPRFVIAKGGITSSDVASRGLEMTRATVVGPMQPGIISMWRLDDGPAAGVPYIVFAGNVGNDRSLVDVVSTLSRAQ
ncbi:four-carbon acid sugar kinase family protein [Corynebacterium pacaense]|uniref:four-carbon acid sugar kinase family protein n=1 Tax=Corynebacterium pacaense TaxID=1816684 RepID=UPI0009BB2BA5|nr:four-carbon acid sugar kinase family protein [Corynebacterium pacaense]